MTPTDTTDAPASPSTGVARTVTDVFQPRNVLLVGMLGIGLAAAGHWTGLLWGSSVPCVPGSFLPGTSNGSAGAAPGATVMSSTAPSGPRSSSSSSVP